MTYSQKVAIEEVKSAKSKGEKIALAGDGRYDSPGRRRYLSDSFIILYRLLSSLLYLFRSKFIYKENNFCMGRK